jgi:hypothetical protein
MAIFCSPVADWWPVGSRAGVVVPERFAEPNQSSEVVVALGGAAGALAAGGSVGAAGAERFAEPNQSSTGVATFGGAAGVLATGDSGVGAVAGAERFAEPNQSSTGVATLGGAVGVGAEGGGAGGAERFAEPNQSSEVVVALGGAAGALAAGGSGVGAVAGAERFAEPNQSSAADADFDSGATDGAGVRGGARNASFEGATVGMTSVGSAMSPCVEPAPEDGAEKAGPDLPWVGEAGVSWKIAFLNASLSEAGFPDFPENADLDDGASRNALEKGFSSATADFSGARILGGARGWGAGALDLPGER